MKLHIKLCESIITFVLFRSHDKWFGSSRITVQQEMVTLHLYIKRIFVVIKLEYRSIRSMFVQPVSASDFYCNFNTLFSKVSKLPLEPTQPPTQQAQEALSLRWSGKCPHPTIYSCNGECKSRASPPLSIALCLTLSAKSWLQLICSVQLECVI
jgi:hypothetical protein